MPGLTDGRPRRGVALALLVSVFIVAACGLVYELVAGALASYLLGDSVLQFSTVIGVYLFAMGVGSWLSRYLVRDLPGHFIRIELMVGIIGGFMPMVLFLQHAWAPGPFRWLLYFLVWLVGVLVGLEIPLVMRLLRAHYRLRELVSQVLTVDYLGALAVSLAFPLVFVPWLGMVRTGLAFGLANVLVAFWALALYWRDLTRPIVQGISIAAAALALAIGLVGADDLTRLVEERLYAGRIVHAQTSPYQRIVLTRVGDDVRLHLNGNLQFSSRDEHRYHEALVLPALAAHPAPARVLILGGGDGLAAREVLREPTVRSVTLVDLDAAVVDLFRRHPMLTALNDRAFDDPRLTVVNQDAWLWVSEHQELFDLILVDLPDPTNFSLNKLYSDSFYQLLAQRLSASGFLAVQATSPLYARGSYWTIVRTIESAGLRTRPYHAVVPSFGEWGFVLAAHRPYPLERAADRLVELAQGGGTRAAPRFLTAGVLPTLFEFPADMARLPGPINRLQDPVLVTLYRHEWGQAVGD